MLYTLFFVFFVFLSCFPPSTNADRRVTLQAKCILEIGPLLPESYVNDDGNFDITTNGSMEETDPCILWLNTRPPKSVLFVSFGSGATHPAPQLLEMAFGLEDSGCSFLWIVRPPGTPGMSATSENPGSVTEFLPPGTSFYET